MRAAFENQEAGRGKENKTRPSAPCELIRRSRKGANVVVVDLALNPRRGPRDRPLRFRLHPCSERGLARLL